MIDKNKNKPPHMLVVLFLMESTQITFKKDEYGKGPKKLHHTILQITYFSFKSWLVFCL